MSADVQLSVSIGGTNASKEELVKLFEKEMDDFSEWLANNPKGLQQGALTRPERALLLTYFMQKFAGNIDAKRYGEETK